MNNRYEPTHNIKRRENRDFKALGEPFLWILGGTLVIGLMMITGFVALITYNGLLTFYPKRIYLVELTNESLLAGELVRSELYKPEKDKISLLPESAQLSLKANNGYLRRLLFRIGNFDLYNEDYKWVSEYEIHKLSEPRDMIYIERIEWGPFIGKIKSLDLNGVIIDKDYLLLSELRKAHSEAEKRRHRIQVIEKGELSTVNYYLEKNRLAL
ncbi:MAG: phosphate ABC transporter permease PstA, partial [Desulfomonilaceae bacterium]